jgi:hypothetical protein
MLLFGLLYAYALSPAPKVPPKAPPKTPAADEKVSPEEAKKRKDWALSMHKKPAPKKGCFSAAYPGAEWREVPCVPAPPFPAVPRHGPRPAVAGNSNDISAQAPSGNISQAIGHFENIINVSSESGPIANTGPAVDNAYTLQINTNNFTSSVCVGSPNAGCLGWQQFVYANNGTAGVLYIQYWIIHYDANCPTGQNWIQFPYDGGIYCYKNNTGGGTPVPNQVITNLGNLTFSGAVSSTGDSGTLSTGTNVYTRTGDNAVNSTNGWTITEFNLFGDGGNSSGGGMASFNAGASVSARTEIIYGSTVPPTVWRKALLARPTTSPSGRPLRRRRRPDQRSSSRRASPAAQPGTAPPPPPLATPISAPSMACSTTFRRRAISPWRRSIEASRFRLGRCRGRRPGRTRR